MNEEIDAYFRGGLGEILIVSDDTLCEKIKENHWREIHVLEGRCNEMTDDLEISGYSNLEKLVFKGSADVDTIANLNSLTISKNPKLKSIEITDGSLTSTENQSTQSRRLQTAVEPTKHGALFNVKTVELSGNGMTC